MGVSDITGIERVLVGAVDEIKKVTVAEGAAVSLMVHQLAFLCKTDEINHNADVYGRLISECREQLKSSTRRQKQLFVLRI